MNQEEISKKSQMRKSVDIVCAPSTKYTDDLTTIFF